MATQERLGISAEAQVDRHSCHERIIATTTVTGSSPRHADRYFGSFLQQSLELWLLPGKVNDGTFVGIQTSALCIAKMFATASCVTIQWEVCLPNDMNPLLSSLLFLRKNG